MGFEQPSFITEADEGIQLTSSAKAEDVTKATTGPTEVTEWVVDVVPRTGVDQSLRTALSAVAMASGAARHGLTEAVVTTKRSSLW